MLRRICTLLPVLPLVAMFMSCTDYTVGSEHYMDRYREMVKELSSRKYMGRGYAFDGAMKASKYIAEQFSEIGADTLVLQDFTIDINTFPGDMELSADGTQLTPGRDFVLREYSPQMNGDYPLYHIDTLNFDIGRVLTDLDSDCYRGAMAVCDFWFSRAHSEEFKLLQEGDSKNAGLIYTWKTPLKFYKAYGEKVVEKPVIWTTEDAVRDAKRVNADIENRFIRFCPCRNVLACVRGERHDSCYVFTAHYDHLGVLGDDTYFPGANDNASGTAAVLTLAEYYSHFRPRFDMWFVAFSGEDANLRGSTFLTQHPVFPLEQIRYLVNLDMIGDNNPVQYCELSDEGMSDFALWERVNADDKCFESLRRGDLAANSDHYPFAVRHVPCIMFENENGDAFPYYHTVDDTFSNVRFDTYPLIFRLVTSFVKEKDNNMDL